MAKPDNNKAQAQQNPADDFNLADFLPKGMGIKVEDLHETGGLTPIYGASEALDGKWPPVAGIIDKLVILKEVTMGKEKYTPVMVLVRDITKPTRGLQGTRNTRKEVEVEAGKDIFIPLTGNLGVNRELQEALTDPSNAYFGVFRITGKEKVNEYPSPMTVFDVKIARKNPIKRSGPLLHGTNGPTLALTESGAMYDKDGQVIDRPLVENRAS